jgi:hypothetical protein
LSFGRETMKLSDLLEEGGGDHARLQLKEFRLQAPPLARVDAAATVGNRRRRLARRRLRATATGVVVVVFVAISSAATDVVGEEAALANVPFPLPAALFLLGVHENAVLRPKPQRGGGHCRSYCLLRRLNELAYGKAFITVIITVIIIVVFACLVYSCTNTATAASASASAASAADGF